VTDDSGNNNSITPNEPVRKDQDTPFNHFVIPPKNTETPKHPEVKPFISILPKLLHRKVFGPPTKISI